jgi:MFS family permease
VGFGLIFGGIPTIVTLYFVQNASLADYGPSYAAGTLAFGVAQMISPQIGGVVADLTGSFALVLVFSAVFAFGGSIAALSLPKQPKVSLIKPLVPPLVFDVSRR